MVFSRGSISLLHGIFTRGKDQATIGLPSPIRVLGLWTVRRRARFGSCSRCSSVAAGGCCCEDRSRARQQQQVRVRNPSRRHSPLVSRRQPGPSHWANQDLLRCRRRHEPLPYHPRQSCRSFHTSRRMSAIKPFLLADIGEGIRECEIIQWFIGPGARVAQFDKLCEVQSDKASVEITSRYDGVVKKLHYEAGDMAIVGKPLVDIDVEDEGSAPEELPQEPARPSELAETSYAEVQDNVYQSERTKETGPKLESRPLEGHSIDQVEKHGSTLATPAVRHLTRQLNVQLEDIPATGKDGRVLKEDVYRFVESTEQRKGSTPMTASESSSSAGTLDRPESKPLGATDSKGTRQEERYLPLTSIQTQMFRAMTKSLTIPHFLYTDEYNLDALESLRARLKRRLAQAPSSSTSTKNLTYLPFIIKAISLALNEYPIINARLDTSQATPAPATPASSPQQQQQQQQQQPRLVLRSQHNISVAMDTPQGLVVPNIKRVEGKSILTIAHEIQHLQSLASRGQLSPEHLSGGTFTVSNIGSLGGTYVAPIIVENQVAILGVGRARVVPAFADPTDAVVVVDDDDDGGVEDGGYGVGSSDGGGWNGESDGIAGMGGGNDGIGGMDPARSDSEGSVFKEGSPKTKKKMKKKVVAVGRREEGRWRLVKRTMAPFSYSADHRVVDGATMARMARRVQDFVEEPGLMLASLR